MSKLDCPVAVLSRSFAKDPILRDELAKRCSNVIFNEDGLTIESQDEIVEFADGYERAIFALQKVDAALLDRLPDLKVISKYGVGLDNVDLQACHERGIKVGWTGGVNRRSVAELTLSFMIACLRHVVPSTLEIRNGKFRQIKGRQLSDAKIGVIGCGHVGSDLLSLLKPFGCEINVFDIQDKSAVCEKYSAKFVDLDTVISNSDVITLHIPNTPLSTNMINAERISAMKDGVVIVNTARGGIVDENALYNGLVSGKVSAAALDVFSPEPPENMDFINLPNLICTGHIGGSAQEAIRLMGMAAIDGLFNAIEPLDHIPSYLK